jgi:hypothetical protein
VPFAAMLHPGHPLMLAVSDLLLQHKITCSVRAPSWWIRPMMATSHICSSCSPIYQAGTPAAPIPLNGGNIQVRP